ncbi:MAG: hypothetical protein ACYCOX_18245 [Acidobacteriaceae bacterium]
MHVLNLPMILSPTAIFDFAPIHYESFIAQWFQPRFARNASRGVDYLPLGSRPVALAGLLF